MFQKADSIRKKHYGIDVYIRGLIEISNYCKNNCLYCGIRAGNKTLSRYRLGKREILDCCENGYILGFRTFVLQSGEDDAYTDGEICGIVFEIKKRHPDCAVTLSTGEKSYESYKSYFVAGADRYLLRHETADKKHYESLHPNMDWEKRRECLWNLKEIGFQVGAGFMVGTPGQTTRHLMEDIRFLQELQPEMIGIGPFIPHRDSPLAAEPGGDLRRCLKMLALLRILFPHALIPATTALGSLHPEGREMGLKAGANVIMPNLSPIGVRKQYALYSNKTCRSEETAEGMELLRDKTAAAGYRIVTDIGNRAGDAYDLL